MYASGSARDRSLWVAWRQAETPHDTRDRIAVVVVLVGGLLAGLIVASSVIGVATAPRSVLNLFSRGTEPAARALSGYQPKPGSSAGCMAERPSLDASFGELKQRLAQEMGDPRECAHPGATGDMLQQTSAGLAIKRGNEGMPIFTNGVEHWALVGGGLLFWTGSSVDPPPDAQQLADGMLRPPTVPAAMGGQPPDEGEAAVVTGTDGTGVVLRASPRDRDWTPRGFMDGTAVRILERSGLDWARVRGANGQEGWVPTRYLGR